MRATAASSMARVRPSRSGPRARTGSAARTAAKMTAATPRGRTVVRPYGRGIPEKRRTLCAIPADGGGGQRGQPRKERRPEDRERPRHEDGCPLDAARRVDEEHPHGEEAEVLDAEGERGEGPDRGQLRRLRRARVNESREEQRKRGQVVELPVISDDQDRDRTQEIDERAPPRSEERRVGKER